jgi:hypothetical protein
MSFKIAIAGTLTEVARLSSDGTLRTGQNTRIELIETGLTAMRTHKFSNTDSILVGQVAKSGATNDKFLS